MRRTPVHVVLAVFAFVTLLGLALRRPLEDQGWRLAPHSWVEHAAILALAGLVFWLGWTVRAFQLGRKPNLDPIRAARTLVLAKAAAITGAILGGRYLAAILGNLDHLDIYAQRNRAIAAGIALFCCVVLTVVGLIVERFCELPPTDTDTKDPKPPSTRDPEPLPG
ncbi:MAG: DUF3180 domain-containing protein [Promicromonosporaceae bacterium]|nr:DUF3180 domain-containing protein [Promicromonosporaceae bacterium]